MPVVKVTRDGELFVFVNDAVIGIPGLYRTFYRNNKNLLCSSAGSCITGSDTCACIRRTAWYAVMLTIPFEHA